MKRKLRVVVLMHPSLVPPESLEGFTEQESYEWKTEYDVVSTLRELGHEVKPLGVADELGPIRAVIEEWKPDIVFNLLEEFLGRQDFDHHVVSFLELMQVPYTGCHPRGLMLARDKALSKKLLVYHHLAVPKFAAFPRGRRVHRPKGLEFPLIVKSQIHEASLGISQASIVENDEKLRERVAFIHQRHASDAIAEQYVEGREFYVGIIGNTRMEVLPVWELVFENMPPGSSSIATAHVKHNTDYQRRRGIYQQHADDLDPQAARSHHPHQPPHRAHPRPRRLQPHRLPLQPRRQALLPRSQSQPGHRQERRVRVRGGGGREDVSGVDSEDFGSGVTAGAVPPSS